MTAVNLANAVGVTLPFVLAALLLGIGISGSMLKPTTRRWIERRVFFPAFAILLLAGLILTFLSADWPRFAILLLVGLVAAFRVVRLIRHPDPEANTPSSTGTPA